MTIGKIEDADADPDLARLNKKPTPKKKPARAKSVLKQTKGGTQNNNDFKNRKKVSFTLDKGEPTRDNFEQSYKEKPKHELHFDNNDEEEKEAMLNEINRVNDNSSLIERTKYEIDQIKREYEIELYGKTTDGEVEVRNNEKLLLKQQPDPAGSIDPEETFMIKPDPIMRLNQ